MVSRLVGVDVGFATRKSRAGGGYGVNHAGCSSGCPHAADGGAAGEGGAEPTCPSPVTSATAPTEYTPIPGRPRAAPSDVKYPVPLLIKSRTPSPNMEGSVEETTRRICPRTRHEAPQTT
jgi:hypothetical protein